MECGARTEGKTGAAGGRRRGRRAWLWLAAPAASVVLAVAGIQPRPGAAQPVRATVTQSREYDVAVVAAKQNPKDAALAVEAGGIAGDLGRHEDALQWFRRAAALDPKLLPAHTGQGQMWLALGWPGRAAAAYERALKLAPQEAEILVELARAYTGLRDLDRAFACARRAEGMAPESAGVYRALAAVSAERQQSAESIRCVRRACELAPEDPANWVMQGQFLLRAARYPEAETALRQALRLDPSDLMANAMLARALIAAGRSAPKDREAFALLARARLRQPHSALCLYLQGEIAVRAGRLPLAVTLLRQAREEAPDDPAILRALAQALTRSGRMEEGVRLGAESQKLGAPGVTFLDVENAAKRAPDRRNTSTLADIYRRQGRYDSAIWALERGLRRTPADPELLARLARARAEAKQRLPQGLQE